MEFDQATSSAKGWSKATNGVLGSLKALGVESDALDVMTNKVAPTISLCASVMELGIGLQKAMAVRQVATETAKAAVLTTAQSMTPVGWGILAGATAMGLTVGAMVSNWQRCTEVSSSFSAKIQANLSNASERTAISQLVGVLS